MTISLPDLSHSSACASELFLAFDKTSSNVTELCSQLALCSGFCEASFETGNLDFTGKGIWTAVAVQSNLALLIGAIFPTLFYIARTLPIGPLLPRIQFLKYIQQKVMKVNLFFSICILVSVFIQNAPKSRSVLETTLLSDLMSLEIAITNVFHWGMRADQELNGTPLAGDYFTYVAVFFAQFYLSLQVSVPHKNFYKLLDSACPRPDLAMGMEKKTYFPDPSWDGPYFWVFIGIVCVVAGGTPFLFGHYRDMLPGMVRRHGGMVAWSAFMFLFASGTEQSNRKFGTQIQLVRSMRRQDLPAQSDWGFGQSTAIMIWLLLLSEPMTLFRNWSNDQTVAKTEEETAESEKAQEEDEKAVEDRVQPWLSKADTWGTQQGKLV